jgi:hypothetical protein
MMDAGGLSHFTAKALRVAGPLAAATTAFIAVSSALRMEELAWIFRRGAKA